MDSENKELWLTRFVLGAAARMAREKEIKEEAFVVCPKGKKYYVLHKMGGSKHFTVYGCMLPPEDRQNRIVSLLKIAQNSDDNQLLATEALVLNRLRGFAREIDDTRQEGTKPFNYGNFFPELVDSFVSPTQGNRRINILSFPDPVESTSQLTQLSSLISKENIYVDPRTSVWILGKTLKILGMAQDIGISNGNIDGSNVLIEKERHGIILFDWALAQIHQEEIPIGVRRFEVIQTVKMAIKAMGGDPEKGTIDSDDADGQYVAILNNLLNGRFYDANEAHKLFYEAVDKIWPRKYWPFTSIPIRI